MKVFAPFAAALGLVIASTAITPSARAEHLLPAEVMTEITQLSSAAGVLSSRSCRDADGAAAASDMLSHLINHLLRSKYFDRGGHRRFRQEVAIAQIQETRTLTHSSRDCVRARAVTAAADSRWRTKVERADVAGVFSLGEWGDGPTELSQAPALRLPATARGRR